MSTTYTGLRCSVSGKAAWMCTLAAHPLNAACVYSRLLAVLAILSSCEKTWRMTFLNSEIEAQTLESHRSGSCSAAEEEGSPSLGLGGPLPPGRKSLHKEAQGGAARKFPCFCILCLHVLNGTHLAQQQRSCRARQTASTGCCAFDASMMAYSESSGCSSDTTARGCFRLAASSLLSMLSCQNYCCSSIVPQQSISQ